MLHLLLYLKQSNSHVVSVAQGSSAFHSLRVLSPHVHIASRREINKSTKPVNKIVDKTIGISNDVSLIRTKSSVPSRSNVVDATSTIHIVRDTSLDSMAAPPNKSAASAKNLPDSLINLSDIENVQDSTPSSTKLKVKWTSELVGIVHNFGCFLPSFEAA